MATPPSRPFSFPATQRAQTLHHPSLDQSSQRETSEEEHTFVVCSDTQLGMTSMDEEWETELEYSRRAVQQINQLKPRPKFCCCCGDLVDMERTFPFLVGGRAPEVCDDIQERQFQDFQSVWSQLHPDIAMVCVCGNHDVGNRPTPASIQRFQNYFGDDRLAFWVNGNYHIVLNTSLINNPTGAQELYDKQWQWLKNQLQQVSPQPQPPPPPPPPHEEDDTTPATDAAATAITPSSPPNIFVFGHHPWFLYSSEEDSASLTGGSPRPAFWGPGDPFPDSYFGIPKHRRQPFVDLFHRHRVTAAFAGHFHQNLVSRSKTNGGGAAFDMITTSSLSVVLDSTGKPQTTEPNTRGFRVVTCRPLERSFTHRFEPLKEE